MYIARNPGKLRGASPQIWQRTAREGERMSVIAFQIMSAVHLRCDGVHSAARREGRGRAGRGAAAGGRCAIRAALFRCLLGPRRCACSAVSLLVHASCMRASTDILPFLRRLSRCALAGGYRDSLAGFVHGLWLPSGPFAFALRLRHRFVCVRLNGLRSLRRWSLEWVL